MRVGGWITHQDPTYELQKQREELACIGEWLRKTGRKNWDKPNSDPYRDPHEVK